MLRSAPSGSGLGCAPWSLRPLTGQLDLAATTSPALDKQLLDVPPHRLSWMRLLARVFRIDLSVRLRCRGPMPVLRAVTCPDEIAEALDTARPPPRTSPRGQLMLFLA